MILYDQKKNGFDVYEMTEIEDAATEYRRKEMETGEYNTGYFHSKLREYYHMDKSKIFGRYSKEEATSTIFSGNDLERYIARRFRFAINPKFLEELLNQYYNGDYKKYSIVRFKANAGIRNFLLTSEEYERRYGYYHSDNILELPESLYLLQMMEQGRLKDVEGKDITEQAKLFTISKTNEVSTQELQKMDACGITRNAYATTSNKAKSDAYVLQLLKK